MARIIDGKSLAATEREKLITRIAKLKTKGITPGLCVILVGDDPASLTYVSSKEKMAHALNMNGIIHRLPASTSQQQLIEQIELLNVDTNIHGILVQLPLPPHIDADVVSEAILPEKDVDGLHPLNAGKLLSGRPCMISMHTKWVHGTYSQYRYFNSWEKCCNNRKKQYSRQTNCAASDA